ncbi:MAG: TolC family outer membrane protein [Gallionella sp.]
MKLKALFVLTLVAASPSVHATDLLDVFHAAQASDPVIAAAKAQRQVGEEKLTQGRALMLPSVNLSANTTYNDNTTQYTGPTFLRGGNFRYNTHGYNLNLVQPLFREQNWAVYSQSQLQDAIAAAQLQSAEQDLVLRSAQAYFDVLAADDGVQLAEAQQAAITLQLAQAKRNFEVGSATITDTHEAQARFDITHAQLLAAQSNLEIKRRVLQQITNLMPTDLKRLVEPFQADAGGVDLNKNIDAAQANNPQLNIAKANAELADKEVERNRGGNYPTLDLVANYGKAIASGGSFGVGSDTRNANIGVQLNVPLFQGGATNSKWREAEANRERAKQELENAHRNVTLQTSQAYFGVVNGAAQVQALQQAVVSSQSVLDASKTGQSVGVRTNLDVLNAQQQLFATRRDLYQAEYNYLVSQLRLKAATGDLTEAGVSAVNQALK